MRKWIGIAIGAAIVAFAVFSMLGCAGWSVRDAALDSGLWREEVKSEVSRQIDTDGDGVPDTLERVQDVEGKLGKTTEAIAGAFPYGETALGIVSLMLSYLGVTRGRRVFREKILNPTPTKGA